MLRTDLTAWQQKKIRLALSVMLPSVYHLIASSKGLNDTEKASLHAEWCNVYGRLEHLLSRQTDPAVLGGLAKLDEALKVQRRQKEP